MSKIFEYLGIIFYLYSRDHINPIHIHLIYAEYESKLEFVFINGKLELVKFLKVKGRKQIPTAKQKDAVKFVKKYSKQIIDKWTEFYVMNKTPKFEKITTKL